MKKATTFILSMLITGIMSAGACAAQGVTVSGTWVRTGSENAVHLYRVEHSRLVEMSSSVLNADKQFGFYFQPVYEGWYVIGNGNIFSPIDKYKFFFKPNDNLNVNVNDSTYVLAGNSSKENKELTDWHNMVLTLERKGVYFTRSRSTYVDFFPDLEKINSAAANYKPAKTGNVLFDKMFTDARRYDLLLYAAELISTPRTAHPQASDFPSFYKNVDFKDLTSSAAILKYPFANRMLGAVSRFSGRAGSASAPTFDQSLDLITNDTLRGEKVIENASYLKTYIGYLDLEKKYGKYIITDDQKSRVKEIIAKLAKEDGKPGKAAIDFTYPDLNGKKVSLSDFKGKVVLVDVWATWCGPCKAELPSLKKMEEEMHNENIVFMSVSVDEEKDHQKWKDFIGQEGLKGVQLFAAGWSDIAKYYDIKGIPRFMVFDKNGNIVSTDAPRPSGTELKLLLENELKK